MSKMRERVALNPDPSKDAYWREEVDLATLFQDDGLANLWNQMVASGELLFVQNLPEKPGKLSPSHKRNNDYSGTINGQGTGRTDTLTPSAFPLMTSHEMIDLWTWGNPPDVDKLNEVSQLILSEQKQLCNDAHKSTLFSKRLWRRLAVLDRYFHAQIHAESQAKDHIVTQTQAPPEKAVKKGRKSTDPTQGLARLGSRAALSFAFAFLRRAWRSGEDSDLCNELLSESLDALQLLEPASLFSQQNISEVWLEVVDRTETFLRSTLMENVEFAGPVSIPSSDRHAALSLLLELSIQKGNLHQMLDMVRLLLCIWNRERQTRNPGSFGTNAPLVPFMKRLDSIPAANEDEEDDVLEEDANRSFLNYMEYPDDANSLIDLQQVAVAVMSHLERLSKPYQPQKTEKESDPQLELFCCGLETVKDQLEDFKLLTFLRNRVQSGIKQIVASKNKIFGLSNNGKLFSVDLRNPADFLITQGPEKYSMIFLSLDCNDFFAQDLETDSIHIWHPTDDITITSEPCQKLPISNANEFVKICGNGGH